MGIYLAVANQLTGITALSIYSTQIFAILAESGLQMAPSTGSFYLGLSALLGSIISTVTSVYLSFRTIFAGGFLIMAVLSVGMVTGLLTGQNTLTLSSLYPYFLVFNITIGCSTFSYIGRASEAAGMSLANMTLWGTSLLLALTT